VALVKNKPGGSWGPDLPINLIKSSKGWLLVDFSVTPPKIVERYRRGILGGIKALERGELNYGHKVIDPSTLAEIDATP
jgi:hypothetical protein